MLKKLKWQFVFVNMILVLLVIIPTFSYMHLNLKKEMYLNSMEAMEEGFIQFDMPDVGNEKNFNPFVLENRTERPAGKGGFEYFFNTFFVELDENNEIVRTHSRSNYTISDENISLILDEILDKEQKQGDIDDLNLRYLVREFEGNTKIAILDTSYEKMMLGEQSKTFIVIAIVIFVIFFGISIILSNMMIKPIEKSWNQQKQFISDASHELKTPTAVILANTSILLQNDNLNEDKKWIDYIDIEARRMKKLVEDLLFLSKSDYTKDDKSLYNFSISDTVLNTILPFEAVIFEMNKKIQLNSDIEQNIFIKGDESQIKQLVTILIDNALKYSFDNSEIWISLKHDIVKNKVVLKVNNPSDIIDKNDLEHLFDRFYKVDKARTRNANSYGLGLSIAKEIVNIHKGKIYAENDEINGTTITVSFNLTPTL
ncbi:MAG: sensor histidine kinase [Lachnospirales bacterium]